MAALPVTMSLILPSCPMTKVARLASPTTGITPAYCLATLPPASESSAYGRE